MSQPNLRSLNEEINNIGDLYSSFREHFEDFSRLEESGNPQSENTELKNAMKWLTHQNGELQRRLDDHIRNAAKLVDSRDAALRKVDNAYKVIRDLVNERSRLQAILASSQPSPSRCSDEERQGKCEAIEEALAMRPSPGTSSRSDRTVRQVEHAPPHLSTPKPTPTHRTPTHRTPAHHTPTHRTPTHRSPTETRSKSGRGLPSPETSGSESHSEIDSPAGSSFFTPPATMDDDGRWSIHYENSIPGASNMSLVVAGDLCLQIHITVDNLVFLNVPMFLEERSEAEKIKNTFILGWGDQEANDKLSRFIGSKSGQTFHTFVFPNPRKKWYYVGGFTFQIANPVDAWTQLDSKHQVLSKLAEQSNLDEGDIAARLDDGSLSQVCIEISSDGLWDESKAFAHKLGYQPRETEARRR
ncbi:hypothetical protein H0H92_014926 [Tricholoma furcatifolium]|nr:hypothetical protein H0H92_014926 [Tricholoma furcatifolium]